MENIKQTPELIKQQIDSLNAEYEKGNLTDSEYNSLYDVIISQITV